MRRITFLLLSVIFFGCDNSNEPFMYRDIQLVRLNDIVIREHNIQMPISGSIEIIVNDFDLVGHCAAEENINISLIITADFTFMTDKIFTIIFSNSLCGNPFTVNATDSTLTVRNNDINMINIPVNVLWSTTYEDDEYKLPTEANQYLWGIKCILTHLFPLTNAYKNAQDILLDRKNANTYSLLDIEDSELEPLLMTFVFDKFERSYMTGLINNNPVLLVYRDTGLENFKFITYNDYNIWDSDNNWIFPTTVIEGNYVSTLKIISVSE